MKWYILALKKYATFTGRSRRKEFWMFVLFYIIFKVVAQVLDGLLGLSWGSMGGGVLNSIYSLAMIVPSLAVSVRRFHDTGRSGWWCVWFLLAFIVTFIAYLIYLIPLAISMGLSAEDMDASVIMQFIGPTMVWLLVFFVIGIIEIVMLARDSQPGTNKWGPNPKEPDMSVSDLTSYQ